MDGRTVDGRLSDTCGSITISVLVGWSAVLLGDGRADTVDFVCLRPFGACSRARLGERSHWLWSIAWRVGQS